MAKQSSIYSGLLHATMFLISILTISSRKSKLNLNRSLVDLQGLKYRTYPRRSEDEAAVIEWGNSAIISAIDASVAYFGPQTSQAALLEVETMPILAFPINGVRDVAKPQSTSEIETDREVFDSEKLRKLDNSDDVFGNAVVMTNTGGLSGVEMALLAQNSGAAALVVVNVDEERPDDIHRLFANQDEDDKAKSIDIPVVMISLNSANVLTTATVTAEMQHEDIINHGMPERYVVFAVILFSLSKVSYSIAMGGSFFTVISIESACMLVVIDLSSKMLKLQNRQYT
jgi:PA domain